MRYYSESDIAGAVRWNRRIDATDKAYTVLVENSGQLLEFLVWGASEDDAAYRVELYHAHRGISVTIGKPEETPGWDFLGEGACWGMCLEDERFFADFGNEMQRA